MILRRKSSLPQLEVYRRIVAEAVLANPVTVIADESTKARLSDPTADCTFDEIGFDSLARLSLAVHLDAEHGIQISEQDVGESGSVMRLAAFIAAFHGR
jgi:acyl carrier protein